jgi:hypothetical protein
MPTLPTSRAHSSQLLRVDQPAITTHSKKLARFIKSNKMPFIKWII